VVRFLPIGECGGAGPRDEPSPSTIRPAEIIDSLTDKFGPISCCEDIVNNNPYSRYYTIEKNGIKFGLASADFATNDPNPAQFKTLRINPNGYVSNDLYSANIIFLPELSRTKRVQTLKDLIKEKSEYTKKWYVEAIKKPLSKPLDFWRFGE